MWRCLLTAHLNMPLTCERVAIGSVHLESMNAAPRRLQQLMSCLEFLEQTSETSLLLGDFNISSIEKRSCSQHWDSRGWKDIDPGQFSWFAGAWRPDHTLLRSRIYVGTSTIMGDQPYGGQTKGFDGVVETPSDHYAIRTQFTINPAFSESVTIAPSIASDPARSE